MGKKRTRKTRTSMGKNSSVRRSLVVATNEDRHPLDIHFNKLQAWRDGKNPWLTVENPTKATNALFIRVRANSYLGDPKAPGFFKEKEA